MDYLTAKHLIDYENKNHVIGLYPRKHMVCIDGFKYFKISPATLNKYNYYKKTNFLINK